MAADRLEAVGAAAGNKAAAGAQQGREPAAVEANQAKQQSRHQPGQPPGASSFERRQRRLGLQL